MGANGKKKKKKSSEDDLTEQTGSLVFQKIFHLFFHLSALVLE